MPKVIRHALIVGSDRTHALEPALKAALGEGACVHLVSPSELESLVESQELDLALVEDDHELIRNLRALEPELSIIAVAESGDVDRANRAVEAGATDFMVAKDRLEERLRTVLSKIGRVRSAADAHRDAEARIRAWEKRRYRLVGASDAIEDIFSKIDRVATVPRPVLVVGERGTGKELVARAIHDRSGRAHSAFVAVNCAALTDSLLESELFGYERGAFTGAERRTFGRFEQAAGGTIFLDEIGKTSLAFQSAILRTVEYGTFTRVGGREEVRMTARIIAATNAELDQEMKAGRFLPDLYDRLAFEVIRIPPLRDRPADIAALSQFFLEEFMNEVPAFEGKRLSKSALDLLHRYSFPGNVRELKNIIERAVYRDTTNELTPEDIGVLASERARVSGETFSEKVSAFERQLLIDALSAADGNQAEAARMLGMPYHRFRYFAKKHEILGDGRSDA